MEDYRDRLRQYLDKVGIKPAYFVDKKLFSNGHINKLLRKEVHIGVDKLENVLRHFSELNPRWLITGDGEMFSTFDAMENPKVIEDQKVLLRSLNTVSEANKDLQVQVNDLRYIIELQKKEIVRLEQEIQNMNTKSTKPRKGIYVE